MLVEITGKRNEEFLITNSRMVATKTQKQHKHILDTIDKIVNSSADKTAQWFIPCQYKDNSGKMNREYLITEQGVYLYFFNIQGYNDIKIEYINAFESMKNELKRINEERKQWEIERAKGVVVRHVLTDTIKIKITDSPNKKFMYPNYTKLIYKILFGKTMKELQDQYGVKGKESIREYITADQLKEVESMEMLVSSLINCGWGYGQIKDFVQSNNVKQIAS